MSVSGSEPSEFGASPGAVKAVARSVNTDDVRSMNNAPLLAKFEYTAPLE